MSTSAKPTAPTPELADELYRQHRPDFIAAIKAIRASTGCGLKDGKDAIDAARARFVNEKVAEHGGIERTLPLRVHKNIVIQFLRWHPEDLIKISPDAEGLTAEEFIAALEAHPGEWIQDGVLKAEAPQ